MQKEFRINQERDAAEVGGHEFNEDYQPSAEE
jgi:hypothetical protein